MSGSLFPVTDEMKMIFKDHYDGTIDSIQKILTSLKEKGYSQVQSVRLIMVEMKLSIVDADNLVMQANAWSKERDGNELLRENFLKALMSDKSESGNVDDSNMHTDSASLLNQINKLKKNNE
jgi:hypothetical protein